MRIQFQLEFISQDTKAPYVIAKLLTKDINFALTKKSFLGKVQIKDELTQPRALDSEGNPRFDLYVCWPKFKNQISEFKVGMILDLLHEDEMNFLEPWYSTDVDLTTELKKEITVGHILYNKEVKTVARRQDNDDVLFEVLNSDFRFARVHLTWTNKPETLPFPITNTYIDWIDLYNNLILKDNVGKWE